MARKRASRPLWRRLSQGTARGPTLTQGRWARALPRLRNRSATTGVVFGRGELAPVFEREGRRQRRGRFDVGALFHLPRLLGSIIDTAIQQRGEEIQSGRYLRNLTAKARAGEFSIGSLHTPCCEPRWQNQAASEIHRLTPAPLKRM